MAEEGLWVPIAMFISVAVIFSFWLYFRYKTRLASQKTFRLALEKGNELTPELVKQLGEPEPSKDRDLRRGLIWLALGIALVIMGFAVNEPEAIGPMTGSAAFPGLIGVAYLIMWRFGARKE
jgi:hypothetical protein